MNNKIQNFCVNTKDQIPTIDKSDIYSFKYFNLNFNVCYIGQLDISFQLALKTNQKLLKNCEILTILKSFNMSPPKIKITMLNLYQMYNFSPQMF